MSGKRLRLFYENPHCIFFGKKNESGTGKTIQIPLKRKPPNFCENLCGLYGKKPNFCEKLHDLCGKKIK